MKSGLQTPAATLQFKEKTGDRGMNVLCSQAEHPLEKSAGTAQPTLEPTNKMLHNTGDGQRNGKFSLHSL